MKMNKTIFNRQVIDIRKSFYSFYFEKSKTKENINKKLFTLFSSGQCFSLYCYSFYLTVMMLFLRMACFSEQIQRRVLFLTVEGMRNNVLVK